MKYKIHWIEWTGTEDKELKDFMDNLPNAKITGGDCKGWSETECFDYIVANDLKELKQKIKSDFYEVEIFTILDDKGEFVMNEENLE